MDTPFFALAEQIYKANRPLFDNLRRERNKHLLLLGLASLLITPALMSFIYSLLQKHVTVPSASIIALPCFIICAICMYPGFNNAYRSIAKKPFLSGLAAQMGLTFYPGGAMRLGDLHDHNLLPPYSTREVEEGFKGNINGFDFEFQDFTISTVSRLGRFDYRAIFNRQPFYGVAMRIHLNRTFRHHTILLPSSMNHALNVKFISFENIDLVFRKFHQSYTIISENQIEARVIFDPAMIERVMALGDKLGANWLGISFMDREMAIIAGQARNFFEIGSLLHIPSVLTIEKVLTEIDLFKSVLEILELNPHTGPGTILPPKSV